MKEIVGRASADMIPGMALGRFMVDRDRLFGSVRAQVDAGRFNGCGLCEQICTEAAIRLGDGSLRVDGEACRGCNLCVLRCPRKALSLSGEDKLRDMIASHRRSESAASFRRFMERDQIGLFDLPSLPGKLELWGFAR